ncbi:MAG: PQQ-dependent sugar dehydrogenase [Planctomycetota bacterium]|nr:PQQ-dependent sugar dehydrogenase [Planctomycetota bacterium]
MLHNRSLMIRVLFAGVALALTTSAMAANNTLTENEKRSGWQLLFDGKSVEGWRNYKKDSIGVGWEIKDGALVRGKGGAGDIITKKQFENFELSIEYRISKGGNSGIMFHVTEDGQAPWHTGPEIQVQDNVDGHDEQKSGWLYQLYSSPEDAAKPVGRWNQIVLRIAPDTCAIYMNGVRYARFQKGSSDWNERVAKSKFAKYENFGKPTKGHICLQDHGNLVAYRNIKIREITDKSADPIDGTLPYRAKLAFTNVDWSNWEPVDDRGRAVPLRPIALTHPGDGSNRVIMATQQGVIHAFENHDKPQKSTVLLDHSKKVVYIDNKNEEGLLGVAFHPKFKDNGQFFLYYTTKDAEHTSVVSRFTVSKKTGVSSSATEEEILRIKQPYWNHNGGTIAFGPDGLLYVALGDGGAGNDPHGNGQNLGTLLGSILRIDVDHKTASKNYSIPKDNPFVKTKGACPEIYAYGLRNVWRLSFDRETGALWAADVGQNLWEEINIITSGGNYGWNLREGMHTFGKNGSDARDGLIEPVWEYDHNVGKSITGGHVYRGKRLPGLAGLYLYADYVTGKIWALKYDAKAKKVVSNQSIPTDKMPVISFGEDEAGEVYFTIVTSNGRGIYRFEETGKATRDK